MTSGDKRSVSNGAEESAASIDATPAELLDRMWTDLCDVLGTPATATLVRRSVRRAVQAAPSLDAVTIGRADFDYHYSLPDSWRHQGDQDALRALRVLVAELRVLLVEMTGPVVVRRLERIDGLRALGMVLGEER